MVLHYIDIFIVIGFLLLMLLLGICKGQGIKNVREYTIGKGKISTLVFIGTLIASEVGGYSTLGLSQKTFSMGIAIPLFVTIGYVISNIFLAYVIVPGIYKFKGKISSGEIMQEAYGTFGRMIMGVLGFLVCLGIFGLQVGVIGHVFSSVVGISYFWGITIGFGVVVLYSTFGGIKAVVFTDTLQVLMIIVVMPILATEGLRQVGMFPQLFSFVKENYPTHISSLTDLAFFKEHISLLFLFAISGLYPPIIQRLLMVEDSKKAQKAFIPITIARMLIFPAVVIIGLSVLKMDPSLKPHSVFPYLLHAVSPIGFKGFAIAGTFAIIMSTADSCLNSGSISIIHDFIKPIFKEKISEKLELLLLRITTFFMGSIAVIIAMQFKTLTTLLTNAAIFWAITVMPALIGQLIGYKTGKKRFCLAMGAGVVAFMFCNSAISSSYNYVGFVPAIFCNILVLFGPIVILKAACVPIVSLYEGIKNLLLVKIKAIMSENSVISIPRIRGTLTLQRILKYYNRTSTDNGNLSIIFGIFMVFNIIVPFFMWKLPSLHMETWIVIRIFVGVCCTLLIFKAQWSNKMLRCWGLFYHFTLTFSLPFMATFAILNTNGSIYSLLNMTASMLMLVLLVDWKNFLSLTLFGVIMGYGTFIAVNSVYPLSSEFHIAHKDLHIFSYVTIFAMIVGFIFSNRNLKRQKALLGSAESMSGVIAHELRTPLASMLLKATMVKKIIDDFAKIQENGATPRANAHNSINKNYINSSKELLESHRQTAIQINNLIDVILNSKSSQESLMNAYDKHHILKCIQSAMGSFSRSVIDKYNKKITIKITNDFPLYCNQTLIVYVLINILNNAFNSLKMGNKGRILIYDEKAHNHNYLIIKDTGIGVHHHQLKKITKKFANFWNDNNNVGIGLCFCCDVMKSINGEMKVTSKENEYTKVILQFPILHV